MRIHPWFKEWFGEDPTPTVIQWHYESFSIPEGATRVATSPACPNQAWAYGPHLAMQFHIEINEVKIDSWVYEDDKQWASARQQYDSVQDKIAILSGIPFHLAQHQTTADHIYQKWLESTEWNSVV